MDKIAEVLILDMCECVKKEYAERKQKMILDAAMNQRFSCEIGAATYQALEKEDRVTPPVLEKIINAKVVNVNHKMSSRIMLLMSKVSKKAMEMQMKLPAQVALHS